MVKTETNLHAISMAMQLLGDGAFRYDTITSDNAGHPVYRDIDSFFTYINDLGTCIEANSTEKKYIIDVGSQCNIEPSLMFRQARAYVNIKKHFIKQKGVAINEQFIYDKKTSLVTHFPVYRGTNDDRSTISDMGSYLVVNTWNEDGNGYREVRYYVDSLVAQMRDFVKAGNKFCHALLGQVSISSFDFFDGNDCFHKLHTAYKDCENLLDALDEQ